MLLAIGTAAHAAPHHVSPATMNKNTRELFQESMAMDDMFYDDRREAGEESGLQSTAHGNTIQPITWFASQAGMRSACWCAMSRAIASAPPISSMLFSSSSIVTPGKPWYGTFRRAPEEQDPAPDAVMWRNFDPNWRTFIGTTFEIILIEYPDRISPELAKRMYEAIDRGIEGEIAEKRLLPSY